MEGSVNINYYSFNSEFTKLYAIPMEVDTILDIGKYNLEVISKATQASDSFYFDKDGKIQIEQSGMMRSFSGILYPNYRDIQNLSIFFERLKQAFNNSCTFGKQKEVYELFPQVCKALHLLRAKYEDKYKGSRQENKYKSSIEVAFKSINKMKEIYQERQLLFKGVSENLINSSEKCKEFIDSIRMLKVLEAEINKIHAIEAEIQEKYILIDKAELEIQAQLDPIFTKFNLAQIKNKRAYFMAIKNYEIAIDNPNYQIIVENAHHYNQQEDGQDFEKGKANNEFLQELDRFIDHFLQQHSIQAEKLDYPDKINYIKLIYNKQNIAPCLRKIERLEGLKKTKKKAAKKLANLITCKTELEGAYIAHQQIYAQIIK